MEMGSLAAALEREHREIDEGIEAFTAHPDSRDGRTQLKRAIHALRRHIYLEEEFLFPLLREAGLVAPVWVMLREHAQIWTTLDDLERVLDGDPAADTRLPLCRQLTVQLQHHNLKEEQIVYPQADEALTSAAAQRLRAFFDSAELPEGWVCEKVRR